MSYSNGFNRMLKRCVGHDQMVWYESPLLQTVGVPHGFSTRLGGVSSKPFDSLNMGGFPIEPTRSAASVEGHSDSGTPPTDTLENIRENEHRLLVALHCENRQLVKVHQVHGCDVLEAPFVENHMRSATGVKQVSQADALITSLPDFMLSIRVADCVPILLTHQAASGQPQWVAAVHAGWRGVVAQVLAKTIQAFVERGVAAKDLLAAIGPCIGPGDFEVGPEVAEQFTRIGLSKAVRTSLTIPPGKPHIDLADGVSEQLLALGIAREHIDRTDRCTFHDADEFFSHRRDKGLTGRMAAVIGCR